MRPLVSKVFFTYLCLDRPLYTKVLFCMYLYFFSPVQALPNVALKKPARQISTSVSNSLASADKAVDGNTDGIYYDHSCTHTEHDSKTWWKVDLLGFYNITSVYIYTRTDCCQERLKNFEVRVSDLDPTIFPSSEGQQCVFYPQQVASPGTLLTCTRPITGRFVSLYKAADNFLTICEIFVFGTKLDFSGMYKLMQDFRISAPVVTSLTAPSLIGCAVRCTSDVTCLGFNVMWSGTRSHDSVTCELLGLAEFSLTLRAQTGWRAYKRLLKE